MTKPVIDIASLTPEERLELIGELWDSLDDLPPALSDEQARELDRRVEHRRQHGPSGAPWPEVEARIRARAVAASPGAEGPLDLGEEWEEEIRRRIDEVDSGRMKTVPGDEVFARLQEKLRRR